MRDLLGGSTKLERCKTSKNNSTVHCVNPPKASTDGDFSDHGGLLQFSQKPQKPRDLSATFGDSQYFTSELSAY